MDIGGEILSSVLNPCTRRKSCIVTYSETNRILLPKRKSLGQKISDAFDTGNSKSKYYTRVAV